MNVFGCIFVYVFVVLVITCEGYVVNKRVRYNNVISAKNIKIDEVKQPKIGFGALVQLITMGAGAPSLGEFKRWEGTKAIFELEANNLVDNEGNSLQTKAKYFRDGYVNVEGENPPGFFENLFSGGKKMEEWSERIEQKKSKN